MYPSSTQQMFEKPLEQVNFPIKITDQANFEFDFSMRQKVPLNYLPYNASQNISENLHDKVIFSLCIIVITFILKIISSNDKLLKFVERVFVFNMFYSYLVGCSFLFIFWSVFQLHFMFATSLNCLAAFLILLFMIILQVFVGLLFRSGIQFIRLKSQIESYEYKVNFLKDKHSQFILDQLCVDYQTQIQCQNQFIKKYFIEIYNMLNPRNKDEFLNKYQVLFEEMQPNKQFYYNLILNFDFLKYVLTCLAIIILLDSPFIQLICLVSIQLISIVYCIISKIFKDRLLRIFYFMTEFCILIAYVSGLILALFDNQNNFDNLDQRKILGQLIEFSNVALYVILLFSMLVVIKNQIAKSSKQKYQTDLELQQQFKQELKKIKDRKKNARLDLKKEKDEIQKNLDEIEEMNQRRQIEKDYQQTLKMKRKFNQDQKKQLQILNKNIESQQQDDQDSD